MWNFKPSGGGGKGGKRSNAGRKIALKTTDWKKYKPIGKKLCDSLVKSNKRVDEFVKKFSSGGFEVQATGCKGGKVVFD